MQLQQVLLNLVMNACDAMTATLPPTVKLIIRTELSDGEGIRVSVADHGAGLAPDNLSRCSNHSSATKAAWYGTGFVGLSHDHYGAWREVVGGEQSGDAGLHFISLFPAQPELQP